MIEIPKLLKSIERIVIAAFTTQNAVPVCASLVLGLLIWKLSNQEIVGVIGMIISSPIVTGLGWLSFAVAIMWSRYSNSLRTNIYEAEIARLQNLLNQQRLGQQELNLHPTDK